MSPRDTLPLTLALQSAISQLEFIDRVMVLPEAASTQDAAFERAGKKPGLLLIAMRQTNGRGRLGRTWIQNGDLGVAATLVLDSGRFDAGRLSLAAGIATVNTVNAVSSECDFGLRWPNDVVERAPGGGRKVAGVLIEVRSGVALVGIGINVQQQESDFPPELRPKAVSLRQLGSTSSRMHVAVMLVTELDRALALDEGRLAENWMSRDVLVGSTQSFRHDGRIIRGRVVSIDPTHEIVVTTDSGGIERLPAMTTSLEV